jgi:xylulose-5-phosphate/fructose-6-phosphate phosphoketolase
MGNVMVTHTSELAPIQETRKPYILTVNGGSSSIKFALFAVSQPQAEHPHGISDKEFEVLFTPDKPIIFAFHGYPWLIHRLTYRRPNHKNLHVRGYKEEGTTSTPFDMVVMNDLDRFHLVGDVVDRLPQLGSRAAYAQQAMREKLLDHKHYVRTYGDDLPEVRDWKWQTA